MKTLPFHLASLAGILATTALLAACHPAKREAGTAPKAPTPMAKPAVDPYQAMAFDAGQGLIGTRVHNLGFKTLDGRTFTLGRAHRDRPSYLKFWATWCTTCRAQMPAFKADYALYGRDIDVVAVDTGVNDDRSAVEAYRRALQLTMPIAIDDGKLGHAFHLRVTPQHVIIGRDGTIRYIGHLEDDRLQHQLQAAIADRPLAVTAQTSSSAAFGSIAPLGDLRSVQGTSVRIDGPDKGVPRLIYFLSPWCETYLKDSRPQMAHACQQTREALTRLIATGKAQVIGIASGLSSDTDGVRRYLSRTGFSAPIVFDGDGQVFRRFEVRSFPTVIRLDADGRASQRLTLRQVDAIAADPTARKAP